MLLNILECRTSHNPTLQFKGIQPRMPVASIKEIRGVHYPDKRCLVKRYRVPNIKNKISPLAFFPVSTRSFKFCGISVLRARRDFGGNESNDQ